MRLLHPYPGNYIARNAIEASLAALTSDVNMIRG
jgi:hypothetical protein